MTEDQKIVWDASVSAAVMADVEGRFALVPVDSVAESTIATMKRLGFAYFGVFGLVQGRGIQRYAEPGCEAVVEGARRAFVELVKSRLARYEPEVPKNDSVSWLDNLWRLPDTRV